MLDLLRNFLMGLEGDEGEKAGANPCETSVLRLCSLQPYALLRRTRSENEFAGLALPMERRSVKCEGRLLECREKRKVKR